MLDSETTKFEIGRMSDVVRARRKALELALEVGFVRPEATKIAVVVSELGRNILNYAGKGTLVLVAYSGSSPGVLVEAMDQGPGIADVEGVLSGAVSSSQGLGLGLSGSKEIMDEFKIRTSPGSGTKIRAAKWIDRRDVEQRAAESGRGGSSAPVR